jgi:2'-5' RNA ligase
MKKHATVYWLLPAKDERELFCEIVRILCEELSAPKFEPHLTILVSSGSTASPKQVLAKVRAKPIRMRIRGTATTSRYSKTLFVRLGPNRAFEKLISELAAAAKVRPRRIRDPHISLLYKRRASAPTKRQLAQVIKLPFREVTFDSIAAVRLRLPVRTRADVEAWRIVARKSLGR